MIDLENRLREEFSAAAEAWDADIDAVAVMSAGRTARRGRTVRRLAVAAAVIVAMTSVSIVVAPPIIAQILDHQTMEVNSYFQWDKTRSEFDEVSVKLQSKGGVVTATATGSREHAVVANKTWTVPADSAPMRVAFGSRAVVVIFPGEVTQAQMMLGINQGGSGGSQEWMPAFGVTVAVWQLESAKVRPETVDWVWLDAAGTVHSFEGARGAAVTMGAETYVVYESQQTDVVGIIGRFGIPRSSAKDSDLLDGAVSWGGTEAVSWQLGVLPVGAHDVQLTLSKPDGEWAAAKLSDGSVLVLVRMPGEPDKVVTGLSYVRADGTTVKYGH
ncbi:MAG TPA: hypothetical protein PKD84_09340 [Propionicimonas sp.]|nr:hypothetical protein [Propionicimonas sp.]